MATVDGKDGFDDDDHAYDEDYQSWLNKRKWLRRISMALILLYGFETNVSHLTFIFFVKDRFHDIQSGIGIGLYYSIAFSCNAIVQMISSLLLGRYVDMTGNIKHVMVFISSLSFTCQLLYSFYPNVWAVVLAKTLLGISEALQSAALGNILTLYLYDYSMSEDSPI